MRQDVTTHHPVPGEVNFRRDSEYRELFRHTVGRARLALAVVAVVVAGNDWRVDVNGVRDRFAQAVSGENHFGEGWEGNRSYYGGN